VVRFTALSVTASFKAIHKNGLFLLTESLFPFTSNVHEMFRKTYEMLLDGKIFILICDPPGHGCLDTKQLENIDALLPWSATLPEICKIPKK
jgi:hypothetical protein